MGLFYDFCGGLGWCIGRVSLVGVGIFVVWWYRFYFLDTSRMVG